MSTPTASSSTARFLGPNGQFDVVLEAAGQTVVVPGGHMLLVADFVRQGPDLVLVGPNGETVLVRGYFAAPEPPALATEGGARISPDLAAKLAGPIAPGELAQADPGLDSLPIGQVRVVAGDVILTRSDGSQVRAENGIPVFQGDVVETEADGSIGIVFSDDTTISLGESGPMVMDELVYDPDNQTGQAVFTVVQGVFTFVSGQIAKTGVDSMTIQTPVANIGIRGTKVAGRAAAEGENSTITLLADDDGSVGEIVVANSAGVQVLSAVGQTTTVTSFFQAPPPVTLSPDQIEQQFGAVLQTLSSSRAAAERGGDDAQEGANGEAGATDASPDGEEEGGPAEDGEGELGEAPLEEGEVAAEDAEGELDPEDELADAGPEGPPGPEEEAAQAAFAEAVAAGSTVEEAFAAAADAAAEQAIAQGAPPEEIAEAIAAAESAYQAAIAAGASPEEAMAAAMDAAGGPGGPGGPDGPAGVAAVVGLLGAPGPQGVGPDGSGAPGGFGGPDAGGDIAGGFGPAGITGFGSIGFTGIGSIGFTGFNSFGFGDSDPFGFGAFDPLGFASFDGEFVSDGSFFDGEGEDDVPPAQLAEAENFIAGTVGADFLVVANETSSDAIAGREGDDYIYADLPLNFDPAVNNIGNPLTNPSFGSVGGNDAISGGSGNDSIFGGAVDDLVDGDVPVDVGVLGVLNFFLGDASSPGNDFIDGGAGNDTLYGGAGADTVIGGTGADTLEGGNGADFVVGGDGNDVVLGLEDSAASDTLRGNAGSGDTAGANTFVDTLLGGQGTDTLLGGQGIDQLTGGVGADVFGFQGGTGTQGTFARAQSLGTDSILDFEAALDSFLLSDADFGLGSTGTLSETANSLSYVETGTTITGTAADTNGSIDSSTGAAFVVVGAQSGGAGFEVWFTTNQEAANTANSYQVADVSTADAGVVGSGDFNLTG